MALIIIPSFAFCHNEGQSQQSSNNLTINESFEADIDISLTAKPSKVQLFEGQKTAVYTYHAELIKGESFSLQEISNSYLGAIIRVNPDSPAKTCVWVLLSN